MVSGAASLGSVCVAARLHQLRRQQTVRWKRGSVLKYQRIHGGGVDKHPNEKPVPLLRELIECSSRFNEIVLDPFMGSGATIEAAHKEGRRAIGIEQDERWCEMSAKRLSQEVFQFAAPQEAGK